LNRPAGGRRGSELLGHLRTALDAGDAGSLAADVALAFYRFALVSVC
jgi:hypothetical protein